MLALFLLSFILFLFVVIHNLVRIIRGYGILGKHYEENHSPFEVKLGNVTIIALFCFVCFLLTKENFQNGVYRFYTIDT